MLLVNFCTTYIINLFFIADLFHNDTLQGAFCAQKCEDIRREFDKLQYYL
jgi:hypothetical protein